MHCAVKTLEHLGVRTIEGILILIRSSSANLNLNAAESIPIATLFLKSPLQNIKE